MRRTAFGLFRSLLLTVLVVVALGSNVTAARAQQASLQRVGADSVRIFLRDVDLRTAVEAIGKYLDRPVILGPVGRVQVELFETPNPIPVSQVREVLRGVVEAHGLVLEEDATILRVMRGRNTTAGQPAARQASPVIRLYTVRLQHARAEDVAAVLNELFGGGGPLAEAAPAEGARARAMQAPGRSGRLTDQVTVVPDITTNSLLVRASEDDYALLLEAVQELDIRPLQVLIEVIIVEARKDREFQLGFSARAQDVEVGSGELEADLVDNTTLADLVVRVMNLAKGDVAAALSAARSRGDVEILSRPVLVAANNTEANLLVGTEQPFIAVSRSLPTDTPQRDQVVQYRDVGTELSFIPTINQDGYVMLEIRQEISQATGEEQFDAPVISTRHAATRLLVGDNQTVVIGGLTDQLVDKIRTGIPLLVDIPVIGGLFGSTRSRRTETEIFLFITPTILYDDAGANSETLERLPTDLRSDSTLNGNPMPDSAGVSERGGGGRR